mgnify:CR=1 FL=1
MGLTAGDGGSPKRWRAARFRQRATMRFEVRGRVCETRAPQGVARRARPARGVCGRASRERDECGDGGPLPPSAFARYARYSAAPPTQEARALQSVVLPDRAGRTHTPLGLVEVVAPGFADGGSAVDPLDKPWPAGARREFQSMVAFFALAQSALDKYPGHLPHWQRSKLFQWVIDNDLSPPGQCRPPCRRVPARFRLAAGAKLVPEARRIKRSGFAAVGQLSPGRRGPRARSG